MFTLNVKNLVGWRSERKIVVISVDDYGNVRLDSKKAVEALDKAGVEPKTGFPGFDLYDTLETRDDLEMLYDVLTSVKDKKGRHAVFTPFAVPCNINFEMVKETGYTEFISESLEDTFKKVSTLQPEAYEGAWNLWEEGINKGIMVPQFHGREHLNLKVFREKLKNRDIDLLTSLQNRSFARVTNSEWKTISTTAAFDFWETEENREFENIIIDGLNIFENVFGFRATHFNAPAGKEHYSLQKVLQENGIRFIDTPLIKLEHQGRGEYKRRFNYTGKTNKLGQVFIVRNVLFEPTKPGITNWVEYTLRQIEAAFRWGKPAVISSHRVNFCGHINPDNRKQGLDSLKVLLKEIVQRWPEVEFMAANELGEIVKNDVIKKNSV